MLETFRRVFGVVGSADVWGNILRQNLRQEKRGIFLLTVVVFLLTVKFFIYSPLRPFLDALSNCKQKTRIVSKKLKLQAKKTPTVTKKLKLSTVSQKFHCKQETSNCKQKNASRKGEGT